MPHSVSDAAVDFLRVCQHGARFNLGAGWKEFAWPPGPAGAGPGETRPGVTRADAPVVPTPALYKRIQVASPPPPRADGTAWADGIYVPDDDDKKGRPLDPAGDAWQRRPVFYLEGIPSLDQPATGTVRYDGWVPVPPVKLGPDGYQLVPGETGFAYPAGAVDQRAFLSVPYPQPPANADGVVEMRVRYFGKYSITWPAPLPVGTWIAVSLDRFFPPERDSADCLARIGDCGLLPPLGPGQANHPLDDPEVMDLTGLRRS